MTHKNYNFYQSPELVQIRAGDGLQAENLEFLIDEYVGLSKPGLQITGLRKPGCRRRPLLRTVLGSGP